MIPWFWIVVAVVSSVTYLLLFRQFTIDHNWAWFIPIFILGLISFYAYYRVFSAGDIGVTYGLMTGSIIILIALGGAIFFREKLTPMILLSLIIIMVGVILLAGSKTEEIYPSS